MPETAVPGAKAERDANRLAADQAGAGSRKSGSEADPDRMSSLASGDRAGTKRRLFWSLGAQAVAIAIRVALQLLLVPVLILAWGPQLYEEWIVVSSATAFLAIIDLGMQTYFGNSLLIAWSRGDLSGYRRHFATGMCLYAGLLLIAVLALSTASLFVSWPSLFGIKVMSTGSALRTFWLLASAALLLIPTGLLTARYRARNFSLSISANAIVEAARGLGVCLVALAGGNPVGAASVVLGVAGLMWVLVGIDQRWRYGDWPIAFAIPNAREFRAAIAQSILYAAPMIAVPVMLNGPIILLGVLGASAGAVIAFSVSRSLTGIVRQIVYQFCLAIGGEMGRLHSVADHDGLRRLFRGAARLVPGLAGLLGGLLLATGGALMRVWTHDKVAYDATLVTVFIVTIIVDSPAQIAYMAFHYTNKPNALVLSTAGQAFGTVAFCALLVGKFSAVGAAVGTGVAEWLSLGLLLPYLACREIDLPLLPYFYRCCKFAALGFLAGYGTAELLQHAFPARNLSGVMVLIGLWAISLVVPSFFMLLDRDLRSWLLRYSAATRLGRAGRSRARRADASL